MFRLRQGLVAKPSLSHSLLDKSKHPCAAGLEDAILPAHRIQDILRDMSIGEKRIVPFSENRIKINTVQINYFKMMTACCKPALKFGSLKDIG